MHTMTLSDAATLWDVEPGFLNSSSYGPPPRPAFQALAASLEEWRYGRTGWEGWAASVEESRALLADMIEVSVDAVSTGVAVSQLLAPIAAAVPDGATVLVPEQEFTSAVFPFAVHADRGVTVRSAPLDGYLDAITSDVDVVAFSAVQSAGGEVADVAAINARSREVGSITVLDATQALGWLDIDYSNVDVGVVGAYKWLCSPRGTGFSWIDPRLADRHPAFVARIKPLAAGWFAGADPRSSYYGLPLRLATDARRFDISPPWHCWVGTAPAVEILSAVGAAAIGEHNIGLANELLTGLGRPPSNSAIVSVPADDAALDRLHTAGVRFGVRTGRARLAFHLYSTSADVDLAVRALRGLARR